MKDSWDLICSISYGVEMYAEFKMVYYAVKYVKQKSNFKCEN